MNVRIISTLLILMISSAAFALSENYEVIRIEGGVTVPVTFGNPRQVGIGGVLEPKVNLNDNISVGGRAELALAFGLSEDAAGLSVFQSYIAKGEYNFFANSKIRPYAGFGLGLYSLGAGTVDGTDGKDKVVDGMFFGFVPSAGVNLGEFRLGANLNMAIAKEKEYVSGTDILLDESTVLRPILSIEFSRTFMGRKK